MGEAVPCCSEKVSEVVKFLLKEIIPRFGLPFSLQSDIGSAFIASELKKFLSSSK